MSDCKLGIVGILGLQSACSFHCHSHTYIYYLQSKKKHTATRPRHQLNTITPQHHNTTTARHHRHYVETL